MRWTCFRRRAPSASRSVFLLRAGGADAEHLGDRPRLERAAGRGVRSGAVRGLGDRAEAPLAEVRLEPRRARRRSGRRRGGRRRRTGRSATARPCPGGRRRRARPGRRGGRAGRPGRRARASAARAASGARAARVDDGARGRGRSPASGPSGQRHREQLVRPHRGVVAAGAVDDVEEPAAVGADEARDERRARALAQRADQRSASPAQPARRPRAPGSRARSPRPACRRAA